MIIKSLNDSIPKASSSRTVLSVNQGYHLNQGNPVLHDITEGDSLWAFTRRIDGTYVLAAELVARGKTLNPPGYRYGRYRLWGDLTRSRYFAVDQQPDITMLVRSLSISAKGDALGRAFQGHAAVRKITPEDDLILRAYADGLPLETRAKLVPEERLEALLLAGDADSVATLIRDEPAGMAEQRRQYLITEAATRNRQFSELLRSIYSGRCQICGWAPRSIYGVDICEAHHIRWLGRGGEDRLSNLLLICPNHHRAIHRVDAAFDWEIMGFKFDQNAEHLTLVMHELVAE